MRREIDRGAAVLGEGDPRIKNLRALCAEGAHDFATANTLFEEMLLDPRNTGARRNLAVSLFGAGDYGRALAQFKAYFKVVPEDGHMPIMADLSARRNGGRERKLLRDNLGRFAGNPWVHAGMRYLLGEITDDQLIALAREGTVFDTIQHECEGWFWIAQVRLAAGDQNGGVQALRRCVSTGFTAFLEYAIAQTQLQRLVPDEAPDERGPRNSRGVIVG
jgi:lipoprotein NlpI